MILDIETAPRPDLVERFIKPFEAFDPSTVKYGNAKDPVKRAEILAQKTFEHASAELEYWHKAKERAALNPLTAEILCIGMHDGEGCIYLRDTPERVILEDFWKAFLDDSVERFYFWSGSGDPSQNFDVNMIIKRSWIRGVRVPPIAMDEAYLSRRFVDVTRRYLLGNRQEYCSLTRAADQLGMYGVGTTLTPKTDSDPVRGENWYLWYTGCMKDVQQSPAQQKLLALQYLENDLLTLKHIVDVLY